MLLLSLLGGFAAILTLVGTASITAYTVSRRTREFGVRLAFGATAGQLMRHIIGDAGLAIAAGTCAGFVGSFYSTTIVSKFLFRTTPHDATTFVLSAAVLAASALVAAWLPARRASTLDPLAALRAE